MKTILIIAQIVDSMALAGFILLQAKGTGLGNSAIFGGSGEFYSSKRGVERVVFVGTIVLSVLFAIFSLLLLVVK
ncbi:preprotein translocase subunit SecG [Patescibacteria group bacterium]|nr:preprotein translocase subunit SecG [Patescibacteria group bacterium]